jgi:glycosyltransferase involved in cell wall biosynthesis
MTRLFSITYLFDSTTLWGGNKVALEQAEALSERGHRVTILSRDSGPTWYPLKVPVTEVPDFNAVTIPESDLVIGTYWPTVKAAVEAGKGIAVHLCQGYEGGFKELYPMKAAIDEVYAYKIPKLTVSPHLNKFLAERFNAETYYVGQMLNRDIFYPSIVSDINKDLDVMNVLVIGPFEADVKNIQTSLKGIAIAKSRFPVRLRLIRVSQFTLSDDEKKIIRPDIYHFHVPHHTMGEIYRGSHVLVALSKDAEGCGLPALEAMACGVPVILSRTPSHLSFGDPQEYAVFVESNPESVSEAIFAVWGSGELRERLSKRGLLVTNNFTRESVLLNLTSAFEEIISRVKNRMVRP